MRNLSNRFGDPEGRCSRNPELSSRSNVNIDMPARSNLRNFIGEEQSWTPTAAAIQLRCRTPLSERMEEAINVPSSCLSTIFSCENLQDEERSVSDGRIHHV